ncbi:MAG: hypothetical protein JXN61_17385 [Sedimentisphaerales bacterium]|nr:hypothetical protein [Sedimentisphaerales bacterium]
MKTPVDNDLNKAYEAFNRNHDHLRQALMASLPERPIRDKRAGRIHHALASIGDTIMRSKITKLAAAAVVIIAVCVGVIQFVGGSADFSTVGWAQVVTHAAKADYVHMYYFKSRGNDFIRHFEAWYAHGKMVMRGNKGDAKYDDRNVLQGFDEQGMLTSRGPSMFAEGQGALELLTAGFLSPKNEQFNEQVPANVGDDFLIYAFGPSPKEKDWMESIYITVGKNSLLPVQMKACHKDGDYDLIIFDYEAPREPAEFFEPPAAGTPNGRAEVAVDGEEVEIPIADAPGLKTAIVRLQSKPSENSDKPSFYLDITFITDEGYRSGTLDGLRLKVDEATQCGTGSAEGGLDKWPDGQYRNVRFSPWLRPTDKENTYLVEIRCFLKAEKD